MIRLEGVCYTDVRPPDERFNSVLGKSLRDFLLSRPTSLTFRGTIYHFYIGPRRASIYNAAFGKSNFTVWFF